FCDSTGNRNGIAGHRNHRSTGNVVHRGRGVFLRNGGGDYADSFGGPDSDWRGKKGPHHGKAAARVLRDRRRKNARPLRMADASGTAGWGPLVSQSGMGRIPLVSEDQK